ncbi:MAG: SRPBCC family protein [Acidimicrobiales bacterium]
MRTIEVTRTILAPREAVFDVTAHIERFAEVIPHITNVEFLTSSKTGVGTRFIETRTMGKRVASSTLEVTEYEPPESIRLVSDEGGTIWDTRFTYEPSDGGTDLTMIMEIRPHTLLARLMTPFIKRFVAKAVESDIEAVKQHCEGNWASS